MNKKYKMLIKSFIILFFAFLIFRILIFTYYFTFL